MPWARSLPESRRHAQGSGQREAGRARRSSWVRIIVAAMSKGRLEAFSDGVIAIIITIMVLELKVPHGADWDALRPLLPVFLTYVLSFVFIGIYWNNHHHMLHADRPDQRRDPVGEPAPAVLAVAGAVRHRLDGREPLRAAADRGLRRACCSWPASPTRSCRRRSSATRARTRSWRAAVGERRQGQDLRGAVRRRRSRSPS